MPGIGQAISGIFGGGGGVPTIGTDIPPTGSGGVPGTVPTLPTGTGAPPSFPGTWSIPGTGPSAAAPLWQQLLLGGFLGTGELGNILQGHKQSQYQNTLLNLINNPAELSKRVLAAEQPISGALQQQVGNIVQGNLAQRGLSQAPGIFATTESQALAPYAQQNYQTALNQVLGSLGLPGQATNVNAPASNLSPLLSLFLRSFGSKGGYGFPGGPGAAPQPAQVPLPPSVTNFPPGITYPSGGGSGAGTGGGDGLFPDTVQ